MIVLGISAFYHDSAAAILIDGDIVAAAQEERFTRKKHDATFPIKAISYILSEANITLKDIDYIVFYDDPSLKFKRILKTHLTNIPKGLRSFRTGMPIWVKDKFFLRKVISKKLKKAFGGGFKGCILFTEHHFSHAASAFYPSPFKDAVVLTIDGVGEYATTTVAIGNGNKLNIVKEICFPNSLGLLYSAFTHYTGFRVNSGEYKLMGLAPYGTPRYTDLILDNLIDVKEDGSFRLDQSYFDYMTGRTMISKKFLTLFGYPARKPDSDPLSQFHMDIAASIQAVTEKVLLQMTRALADEYKIPNLCLAGGVALNCVANGKILRDKAFENIWIQPAAGDAGGALGAALGVWHNKFACSPRTLDSNMMKGSYLGPSFSDIEIEQQLSEAGVIFQKVSDSILIEKTVKQLIDNKAIGWFQGRMEFGPRALGNRSILGDPRSEDMQKLLNLKVKFRESFRPFAPSVLREDVGDWFEMDYDSPYMSIVTNVQKNIQHEMTQEEKALFGIEKLNVKRSNIPAVTHVDYSARVQTVHSETNPLYHALISEFKRITGCSLLVNTSFNIRGEPIVCTPLDAFKCFMGTNIDFLVIGNFIIDKKHQK
tara:strand:+ start:3605 stop:5395 length:1791 start_codon:yes stop_codon:yes gene_type:complete